MDAIIRFFKNLFFGMFRSSGYRYQRRLESKLRSATVGKLQAKMLKTQAAVDQKVFKAQDKAMPGSKSKKP
ncbi:MAG: hypothetical protein RBU37_15595 [Myxococcota bacterium]|jgi:hypothetical protein|nr:hypothetical protein [Myxococcota bacterium]